MTPLRGISLVGLVVMIPLVFFFTTRGAWNFREQRDDGGWSGGFYKAQAESMLEGHFDVPRKAIQGECFDYKDLCFGYFGVTPSLIRLPFIGILRWLDSALPSIFLGVAVLLGYWAAVRLVESSVPGVDAGTTPRWMTIGYHAAAVLALGPGGTLIFVTRPAVYEEAVAWGIAFFLLALMRVASWVRTRATRDLVWAVLLSVFAANARLTFAVACIVVGALVVMLAWRRSRSRLALALGLGLALLPGATTAGVFILKFDTPWPEWRLNEQIPEALHWQDIMRRNGDRITSVIFVPTALVAYLRPDAVAREPGALGFDFRFPRPVPVLWVPPLPPGGAYVEYVASLTSTMPGPWAITLVMLIWLPRARRQLPRDTWLLLAGFMTAATAMIVPTVTHFAIANRYLAEFFPLAVIGTAAGAALVPPFLARRPALAAMAGVLAAVAIVWAAVVTASLQLRLVRL